MFLEEGQSLLQLAAFRVSAAECQGSEAYGNEDFCTILLVLPIHWYFNPGQ
jgi:hypothetical protein